MLGNHVQTHVHSFSSLVGPYDDLPDRDWETFVDANTKEPLDTAKFVSLYTHKRDKKGAIQWVK